MNAKIVEHVEREFVKAYQEWHRLNDAWPYGPHTPEASAELDEALRVLRLCREQMGVLHG